MPRKQLPPGPGAVPPTSSPFSAEQMLAIQRMSLEHEPQIRALITTALYELAESGLPPPVIWGMLQGAVSTSLGQVMTDVGYLPREPVPLPPYKAPKKGRKK